mgnify:CR=1 FL=1
MKGMLEVVEEIRGMSVLRNSPLGLLTSSTIQVASKTRVK